MLLVAELYNNLEEFCAVWMFSCCRGWGRSVGEPRRRTTHSMNKIKREKEREREGEMRNSSTVTFKLFPSCTAVIEE
jgi:hypothetical protein